MCVVAISKWLLFGGSQRRRRRQRPQPEAVDILFVTIQRPKWAVGLNINKKCTYYMDKITHGSTKSRKIGQRQSEKFSGKTQFRHHYHIVTVGIVRREFFGLCVCGWLCGVVLQHQWQTLCVCTNTYGFKMHML